MRKQVFPLLFSALLVLASSCNEPESPKKGKPFDPGEPTNIVVNVTALEQATRTEVDESLIKTQWAESDEIGIYVLFNNELVDVAGSYQINPGSISDDKASADFHGDWKWHAAALPHRFYAYAPKTDRPSAIDEAGNAIPADANPQAVPVSVPAVQTQNGYESEYLSKYNFWIAKPIEKTAPRDFNDPELDRKVYLEMKSAFAILEFRFASWEGTDPDKEVIIQKLTLTSDKRPLALSKGTIDITKPFSDTDFGQITVAEADLSNSVTLNIVNGKDLPESTRKTVIIGNKVREPFDPNVVFPARMLVMPNRSIDIPAGEEEQWILKVDFTINGEAKTHERVFSTGRPVRPGERHAIPVVLVTADGAMEEPPAELPGTPWDGTSKVQPAIDEAGRVISISTPAELAWLSDAINNQPDPADSSAPRLYDNYTIRFTQNINLGDKPWTPIGYNSSKTFRGSIDGGGCLVSGLNINPEASFHTQSSEYVGLFGRIDRAPGVTTGNFDNLRVKGKINLPNFYGGRNLYAGGVAAQISLVNMSGCRFDGEITAVVATIGHIGGVIGACNSLLTDCRSTAVMRITSEGNVGSNFGGIVGYASGGTIKACEFTGSIQIPSGDGAVGGIAGQTNASIKACRNTGALSADSGMEIALGGIAGILEDGTIRSCYNTGNITGTGSFANTQGSLGGIAGIVSSSYPAIRGCYSRGRVTASRQYVRQAGNIFGRVESLLAYDYSKISYNYYLHSPLHADLLNELEMTAVMQFSTALWPSPSYPDWGTGDGSADNKYWNEIFFDTYGVEEWEYPQLYWEVIE